VPSPLPRLFVVVTQQHVLHDIIPSIERRQKGTKSHKDDFAAKCNSLTLC
jgi:hypothetical protein